MTDHLDDLESDFSAIHGIHFDADREDFGSLSAARFFRLAERMPAYEGFMRAIVMSEETRRRKRLGATDGQEVNVIDLTPEMAAGMQAPGGAATGLEGLIEFGHG